MKTEKKGSNKEKLASLFLDYLREEHNISEDKLDSLFEKEEKKKVPKEEQFSIPISVLSIRKVGSFEAIVKFLKENKNLSAKKIAELTNRSRSTIGVSYHNAQKKLSKEFPKKLIETSNYSIPVSVFASRELSVLESIVSYLRKEHELSFSKIAQLLNRDDRTIWTVNNRANQKRAKNEE